MLFEIFITGVALQIKSEISFKKLLNKFSRAQLNIPLLMNSSSIKEKERGKILGMQWKGPKIMLNT